MHHETKISITPLPCINKITVSCSKQHEALNFAVVGRPLDYACNGRKTIRKASKLQVNDVVSMQTLPKQIKQGKLGGKSNNNISYQAP